MLKWIGRMLGGTNIEIPPDLSDSWVQQLKLNLDELERSPKGMRSGIAQDLLQYVVTGEPLSVLNEISKNSTASERLRLTGYGHDDTKGHLYKEFDDVPVEIVLRWAKVLETSVPSSVAYTFHFQNGMHWPELLLLHYSSRTVNSWGGSYSTLKKLSAATVEKMLVATGAEPSALLVSVFATPISSGYGISQRLSMVTELTGYAESIDRHIDVLRPLVVVGDVAQRLHVISLLEGASTKALGKIAAEICALAVANSKQVRAGAEVLVTRGGKPMLPPLQEIATTGKPDQRVNALRLLYKLALQLNDDEIRAFAREAAQKDKAPSAQALLAEWAASKEPSTAEQEVSLDFVVPAVEWRVAMTSSLSSAVTKLVQSVNQAIATSNKQMREHNARMAAQGHHYKLNQEEEFPSNTVQQILDYLTSDKRTYKVDENRQHRGWQHVQPAVAELAGLPDMTPVALFKILQFFNLLLSHDDGLNYAAANAFNILHRAARRPTLIELDVMVTEAGGKSSAILGSYCQHYGSPLGHEWGNDAVWPYFVRHFELLEQYMTVQMVRSYNFNRSGLFRAIGTLPAISQRVANTLFAVALGSGKSERADAQQALANYPNKEARIVAALSDGKSDARMVAATWLAQLRYAPAVAALELAAKIEKHDVAKGAMLDALQALGQPVEKYLSRDALASEAKKALSKGTPKDLDWMPWSALPEVRWADSKEAIDPEVLRWLIVQAFKQKSPEPNAILRKYCAMFEPRDRETLGQFLLETWLREDVRPIPQEQALKMATDNAQSTHQSMQSHPQYYKDSPWFGKSVDELKAIFLPSYLRQPQGSIISSKGVLAVSAACAAERAAAPVARYLKEYYGTRAAQGKALIAMLAWIEHPSATQVMLSIGNRFRTKSFQEEATKQAQALADRKGWTLSELADRTIPSAGFDETSTLELSYGDRVFTAKLLPDFKVELFNPDGKKIASLPEPRQDDNADLAKDSKKTFSAAKKEIKSIVELQTDRLYEALCTERDWSFQDWSMHLNQHAVVRHLVERLVWVQMDNAKVARTFRPLEDGTLTDCNDDEVTLDPASRVRVAHDSLLAAVDVSRWQQHLIDYKISPLFQQLGKGTYELPDNKSKATSIDEFQGYILEAFALRGRALKLGYTRGSAEDGGWFRVYQKRFQTLGLVAEIEFTGNPLPEENRAIALISLSFTAIGQDSWNRPPVTLKKVPKILLSECYNDLRLIASEGSGFDPDWRRKTEY